MARRIEGAHGARRETVIGLKVLSPDLAQGLSAERFEREIQLAASLQQANIVPVLATGETGGMPYYTMPFVEGESLSSRLKNKGAMSIGEAVSVLRDVARALQFAHERGIVHRDIKPDNVLLSGATAVATDFGIAKAIAASRAGVGHEPTLTQLGTSIGAPAYISPGGGNATPDLSCSGGAGGRGGNNAAQAPPGTYNVKLTVNGHDYTKPVVVLDDVWLHER